MLAHSVFILCSFNLIWCTQEKNGGFFYDWSNLYLLLVFEF